MHKLKINNSLKVARWDKLPCKCNHDDIEQCYPISKCAHCRCQECWDSVPKENFKVKVFDDDDGKLTGTKTVNEITVCRGHNLQDVQGWFY